VDVSLRKAGPAASSQSRCEWLGGAVALLFTLAAYLRSLDNGFVYDDNLMVTANRHIGDWSFIPNSFVRDVWWFRDPGHLPQSQYYRPLEDVWLALNYHLFGLNPLGWHAAMVAVHLVAVWLVFCLARALTRDRIAAAIAALLFGVMPIHADTISWGRSIPLPLSAIFQMGALLCFIRRASAPRRNLALALTLFALALLTHEGAVVFPVIIAAYVFLLEGSDQMPARAGVRQALMRMWRSVLAAAPFFAIDAFYLAVRLWVLGFITYPNPKNTWSGAEQILTVPAVLADFVLLLLAPWRAGPAHEVWPAARVTASGFYLPATALLAGAASTYLLLRRHPHRRLNLFCVVWIVIGLAPVLNLKSLNPVALVQDRYLYMSSAAWCILLGDLAGGLIAMGTLAARIATAAAAVLAVAYGASLWNIERYWYDDLTYFTKCVQDYPASWLCRENLAAELWRRGDLRGAERELEAAIPLDPSAGRWLVSLGMLHVKLNQLDRAEDELARGLRMMEHSPMRTEHPTPQAYMELGQVAAALGDHETRRMAFERARAMLKAASSAGDEPQPRHTTSENR
jgi:protein O-mannosyl-transferase